MAWSVNFYEDATGNAPVEQFLDGLTKKQRAKLVGLIDNLKQYGLELPFPYSSHVRGRIWELRTRFAKARLRILYFGDAKRVFILLHGVVKDTEKLEESDIRIAEQRMADHNQRLGRRK